MTDPTPRLRIAFIHPDLGIGGAERLVVDAALGLQKLGHSVDIYTSHHDPTHCFDETRDGTLRVHNVEPPFPRAIKGKFHILLAHLRQLHLTSRLVLSSPPSSSTPSSKSSPTIPKDNSLAKQHDVYFVDQLSTCVPLLRLFAGRRVVFYCHFPDKLLANGEFSEDVGKMRMRGGWLKRVYRMPMDWVEEVTTRQADMILANSNFTARVFKSYFPSIPATPRVVHPGINLSAYDMQIDRSDPDIQQISSDRPTLLSLNRFEKKKNVALAITSFALLRKSLAASPTSTSTSFTNSRLVIAGGYDPRVEDNMMTLVSLIDLAKSHSLSYTILTPSDSKVTIPPFNTTPSNPDITFLLNFTTAQRSALLTSPSTLVLLYTPTNEHFGIGPVEAMACALPVLACSSGGPVESVVQFPASERTGWLREPEAGVWAEALEEIVGMGADERRELGERARRRAREKFGMEAMARDLEGVVREAARMGEVRWGDVVGWGMGEGTALMALVVILIAAFVARDAGIM
ncbi:glycosyltransferase family 4 protein [Stereum hirsutum FP-91666 SS1]|uniref:glycosyltransferase family 4 protein n=1 Tax=Stereum hirsutum (strain FP-91666) TaxID=721885 RepID=UPI000444A1F2|nr:glycosyltransferase family 4 protein [Stereum hirsutum FP-91666 SS1]EIM82392.1 glycosyltransferase family 4 protein [Stereum hirsutum FP-91666 SS1]